MFYERTPTDVRSSKDFRNLNFNKVITPNARSEEEEEESSIIIQEDAMMNEMDSVTPASPMRVRATRSSKVRRAEKVSDGCDCETTDADLHNAFSG